jgi:L-2,4-diaminobutyrate decarboxylase
MFETSFLTAQPASQAAYQEALQSAAKHLLKALPDRAYSGKTAGDLADVLQGELCPARTTPLEEVLERVETVVRHSIAVTHPFTAAHLHCPPLLAALAAEVVLTALNQSMDSFDQAPAATVLEQGVVRALCREARLPAAADGIFTAGGTQSNYMGLLLARDEYLQARWGWCARERGLPPGAQRFRILCSEMAHFTVEKSAAQLGLGAKAVVRVAVDDDFRMCPRDLQARLDDLRRQDLLPIAVVATAGTTDFGSIDPLAEIAGLARRARAWLHVDAAYGGALLFAGRSRRLLDGIELADSLSVDFHKLLWQSISCGAFLVRDAALFAHLQHHADYLNPECHEDQGVPDLVTRSVATTRRFDALKLWMSLQVLGRERIGAMVERTLALARAAYAHMSAGAMLKPLHEPTLGCVVFRYRSRDPDVDADALNVALRQRLFDTGTAVIGQTRVAGQTFLKLTCLNPCTTETDISDLLDRIQAVGQDLEEQMGIADCRLEKKRRTSLLKSVICNLQ